MNDKINLTGLLPDFTSLLTITGVPETSEQLSAAFVAVLIAIFSLFILVSIYAFLSSRRQIVWLTKLLKKETTESLVTHRQELIDKSKKVKHQGGHLWQEYDETLIEIEHHEKIHLYNTIDSHHFFNNSTLANKITESRLIAAVPGFLTAFGVIGTFVGLQLGLSELNIGNDAAVSEMKAGLAHVISGAKIAFMTSVWGVSLSVIFNFFEKFLESRIRRRILKLQTRIDNLFPRLSVEGQLQRIAEDGHQSRESLQGLAEKIGEKMQESLLEATAGIQSGLEASLEKIMAPAINKLVDETSDGNQKALDSLVSNFMERFGEMGDQQKESMNQASQNVSNALESLKSSMTNFLEKLELSQSNSADRENELIKTISTQVNDLVDHSVEQRKTLTEFVEKQLNGLSDRFKEQERLTNERDEHRQKAVLAQAGVMKRSSEALISSFEKNMETQNTASKDILKQGEQLQSSVQSSVDASIEASSSLSQSAKELHSASQEMKVFGSHIRDAGNNLAGAVTQAVESTNDLAQDINNATSLIEKYRQQMLDDQELFKQLIHKVETLFDNADSSFDTMKQHQTEFLSNLKSNVQELSKQMTQLLNDYAQQANSQTERHLGIWAETTTNYAEQMNSATRALSGIVDEIEVKLGR